MISVSEQEADGNEVWTLLRVTNLILAERRLIGWTVAAFAIAVVGGTVLSARSYSAGFSFFPQSSNGTAGIAGIAAQFGVELPVGDVSRSPEFYVDLLASREVLGRVVDRAYSSATGDSVRLPDLFAGFFSDTERARRDRAMRLLRDRMSTAASTKSGIVKATVSLRDSVLVEQVARAFLENVVEFDVSTRRSQSAAERKFAEERVAEVAEELRVLEDRLESFLRTNREYLSSPTLTFEHDRMMRQIVNHQQLLSALVQSFERARIEEVRDTPMLTLIDLPTVPSGPVDRHLLLKGLAALIAGFGAGVVLALVRAHLRVAPENRSEDLAKFHELTSDIKSNWIFGKSKRGSNNSAKAT